MEEVAVNIEGNAAEGVKKIQKEVELKNIQHYDSSTKLNAPDTKNEDNGQIQNFNDIDFGE